MMYGQAASFTECLFLAIFDIVQTSEKVIINKHKFYIHKSLEIIQLDPTSSL